MAVMKNKTYPLTTTPVLQVCEPKANEHTDDPPNDEPKTVSKEEHERMLARVRNEERTKLNASLEAERNRVAELERAQRERDERDRQAELERMKPNERSEAQMRELTDLVRSEREARLADKAEHQRQLRAAELVAYRERAIREFNGEIIAEMVVGNSEAELDASADRAHQEYKKLYSKIHGKVVQELGAQPLVPPAPQTPQAWTPPPNPAYTQQPVNLPTPTNVPTPVEAPTPIRELTTEEAVRSGKYGGEVRRNILKQIGVNPIQTSNLGSTPRHMTQVELPGGAQQPVAQPPVPATPPGGPVVSPTEQARAAAVAARAAAGIQGDPQQAYSQRFQPTPPIAPQGQ